MCPRSPFTSVGRERRLSAGLCSAWSPLWQTLVVLVPRSYCGVSKMQLAPRRQRPAPLPEAALPAFSSTHVRDVVAPGVWAEPEVHGAASAELSSLPEAPICRASQKPEGQR
jgi:hypothetical protein